MNFTSWPRQLQLSNRVKPTTLFTPRKSSERHEVSVTQYGNKQSSSCIAPAIFTNASPALINRASNHAFLPRAPVP